MGTWWERWSGRLWRTARLAFVLGLAALAGWRFLWSPVVVGAYTVATENMTAEVMGTGTLEARTSAIVGPKIGGLIARITADEGDEVRAGQVLFELEDSDLQEQVAMAESEVDAAIATQARLEAAWRGAEAVLDQATTNHERVAALTARNGASRQDLDKAVEALAVAQAGLSEAGAAITEGEKRREAAERSLEYQRARLRDATISAPFDGLIVQRVRDVGDVVTPAASVFQIISTDEMWVSAWVDETELARLHGGENAHVVFRSEPGREYPGTVARVGREVDRETREVLVDVHVEQLPPNWAAGQRAEVYILVDRRDAVVVLPARLLLIKDDQAGVMVAQEGRAHWRPIAVGLRGRDVVEVTEGLSAGDVVLDPAGGNGDQPSEGRRVTVQ
jgi:RND family efflux transporter MFP subunit